jgi:hypothetical protein
MQKIAVITAITGTGRDTLLDQPADDHARYVAYTQQPSVFWETKPPCSMFVEPKKNAKIHKVLAHKYEDCDTSIWLDGNVRMLRKPSAIISDLLGEADVAVAAHFDRKDVYTEGAHILAQRYDLPENVTPQLEKYKALGFKEGLFFCSVLIRRHNSLTTALNEAWWAEICRYSWRDQLSFPFILDAAVRNGLKVSVFTKQEYQNFFLRQRHTPITY